MKISIFASIGAYNLGDELIVKNEIKQLEKKYGKNIEFSVFTYDVKNPFIHAKNITYYEYFPCNIKSLKGIFKNVLNLYHFLYQTYVSNMIVIGGGGIFFDSEHSTVSNPLNQWVIRSKLFQFFRKKVIFQSVGIHIHKKKNYQKIKKIFSINKAEVYVRDDSSQKILSDLRITSTKVLDPVFYDNAVNQSPQDGRYCLKKINISDFSLEHISDIEFGNKYIGIAFRSGYLKNEYTNISDIIEFVSKKGGKIVLIPHSFHPTDRSSNDYFFLRNFSVKYNIKICEDMKEVYKMYSQKKIDICLTMRLHSIILSQVYEIPFISFSYSKKTDEVLSQIS
ncbi:MAG: polysaccharide pyruvyl transferase family protein [Candidatus Gracilibacteria bacterium]|nr:polysaccharide pyruvyl transferase family protein [Candidatus Gracilibacteria bacterium]